MLTFHNGGHGSFGGGGGGIYGLDRESTGLSGSE